MIFDHFDRIRIVNLAHRKDRRAEMRAQLARVGLSSDSRVEFFPALSFDDPGPFRRRGSHGNFKSRIPLLKESGDAGHSILILEDDCDFLYPQVMHFVMPDDWDIFYGGYVASDPQDLHNSDIIGSHFMGFSPRAAQAAAEYLTEYLKPDFPPDPRAALEPGFDPTIKPSIDGALVWFRRSHPQLITVFADLGYQRSSRTDVGEQTWFDRIPALRELGGMARKLIRPFKKYHSQRHVFSNR